jgi:hypothetical protein
MSSDSAGSRGGEGSITRRLLDSAREPAGMARYETKSFSSWTNSPIAVQSHELRLLDVLLPKWQGRLASERAASTSSRREHGLSRGNCSIPAQNRCQGVVGDFRSFGRHSRRRRPKQHRAQEGPPPIEGQPSDHASGQSGVRPNYHRYHFCGPLPLSANELCARMR